MRNSSQSEPAARFQFTVGNLLLLVFTISLVLALLVVVPASVAVPVIVCLAVAIPTILTICTIYGTGYLRTFCIGALFPAGLFLYTIGWFFGLVLLEPPNVDELDTLAEWNDFCDEVSLPLRAYGLTAWILSIVLGLMSAALRKYFDTTN